MKKALVIISAGAEWRAVRRRFPDALAQRSPYREWFQSPAGEAARPVVFLHGGWGKISAAATAQYGIDRWAPDLLVNLGTCGGFTGRVAPGAIILANRTIVYDIVEQMSDAAGAISFYSTEIDLTWLEGQDPPGVIRTLLVSADRDLVQAELPELVERYGAVAGDWESGAIAWVAARHGVRTLILRGVSDLVGPDGDEVYGNYPRFEQATQAVMDGLLASLPDWLRRAGV